MDPAQDRLTLKQLQVTADGHLGDRQHLAEFGNAHDPTLALSDVLSDAQSSQLCQHFRPMRFLEILIPDVLLRNLLQ
jgi:hypothetical protein